MAISSSGVGSGLNIESIVSQLLALEREPLNRLERNKFNYNAQLSAYGRLNSAVSSFQTALGDLDSLTDFKLYSATPADETAYTATANSSAEIGTYDIQVNRLAEAHKISSKVFADTDTTTVGGGDLTLTIGSDAFTITGAGSMTLEGLRDAINNATDNAGVTASILTEDTAGTQNYLVLTSDSTGSSNAVSLTGTAADVANLNPTDINTPALLDAEIVVDNTFTINRSNNVINDAITGVTLNLKSTSASNVNLRISRDTEGVSDVMQGFVDAYNSLADTIDELRQNELSGDNVLLSIENQFRSVLNNPPSGLTTSYKYLVEVGVAFDKNGRLTLDADDLENAITTDYDGLAELFANDNQGYAFRLGAAATSILSDSGLIDGREDGINRSISTIDNRIEREEFRLELVEERLRAQFSALDALVANLNSSGDFLLAQLDSISKIGPQNNN